MLNLILMILILSIMQLRVPQQYNMCVMWLKPFGHPKSTPKKKRPSFWALGKKQAAMGQVSDNAAMGHVSKEMQPVAVRSIKKVVRTGFAHRFVDVFSHWL